MSEAGKGSRPRPRLVSRAVYFNNYQSVFFDRERVYCSTCESRMYRSKVGYICLNNCKEKE